MSQWVCMFPTIVMALLLGSFGSIILVLAFLPPRHPDDAKAAGCGIVCLLISLSMGVALAMVLWSR